MKRGFILNKQLQKVISGLEHHAGLADVGCWKVDGNEINLACPYYDDKDNGELDCATKVLMDAIELLKKYDIALRMMVYQYCVDSFESAIDIPERFNHSFMSAGETAFKVLGIKNGEEVPEDFIWS